MLLIGISGPSCSGKSTLARHLRLVLPRSLLVYEDDYYRPESELPLDSAGRENWDCPDSFNLQKMRDKLLEVKKSNVLPAYMETREDLNNPSECLLTDDQIAELAKDLHNQISDEPVLIVDGILLFHRDSPLTDVFDLGVLIPFEVDVLRQRRLARKGYETGENGEGFWVDPPGYFDELVWPEFVKYSSYLYAPGYKHPSEAAERRHLWMPPSDNMYVTIHAIGGLLHQLAGNQPANAS